jgi:hypothetical protein
MLPRRLGNGQVLGHDRLSDASSLLSTLDAQRIARILRKVFPIAEGLG